MIVTASPATLDLDQPGSIPTAWVLSGNPETRSKMLGRTHDWTSNIVVWECGAGELHVTLQPRRGNYCDLRRALHDKKVDKIIVDGTGEMRQLRNTVFLEGSLCGCACVAFGGCPRGEFAYWREIWLRRSAGLAAAKPLNTESWHTPERVIGTTGCMEKEQ